MAKKELINRFIDAYNLYDKKIESIKERYKNSNPDDRGINAAFDRFETNIKQLYGRISIISDKAETLSDASFVPFCDWLEKVARNLPITYDYSELAVKLETYHNELSILWSSIDSYDENLESLLQEFENKFEIEVRKTKQLTEKITQKEKEIDALLKSSEESTNAINFLKETFQNEISALKETIETYKESAKAETSGLELRENSRDFFKAVDKNEEDAQKWRGIIIGLAVALIVISGFFLYCCWLDVDCLKELYKGLKENGLTQNELKNFFYFDLFKKAAIRIFIISVIVYLLKFAVVNYRALQHNKVINLHKANSLEAARRIISLFPQEDKIRESILTMAGKEIFTQHKTGYLYKDEKINLDLLERLFDIVSKKDNK